MTGKSLNDLSRSFGIIENQLEKLKQLFPEAITEGKIDWEKLQATLGKENIEFLNERYVLNWAGKADAFKVLQQSTTATLKPCPGEGINDGFGSLSFGEGRGGASENVFIEGENLEVLKVLQKAYYGKVKCIIIDPPYNTGNDSFIYPDSFKESKEDYQKRIGDKDEEGYLMKEGLFRKNSKDSGHYHSNWLCMMYPRLFLAKNLLRDDGVIFVHIDDNEVHNLRLIMNEIFGEENFIVQILWKKRSTPPNDQIIGTNHDYILVFAKDKLKVNLNLRTRNKEQIERYKNPDNHTKGPWTAGDLMANVKGGRYVASLYFPIINPKTEEEHFPSSNGNWRFSKETIQRLISNNEIYFGEDGKGRPKLKRFFSEVKDGITYPSIWDFVPLNTKGSQEMSELLGNMNIFDNPKPVGLINEIIRLATDKACFILDFFAGSATTAQAVLELNKEDGGNRKFILVQLPELCNEESEAYKAGYKTIADIGKERIRRVIKRLNQDSLDSKINLIKDKEQQKLFADEKNQENQVNQINHGSDGFKVFKLSSSNFKIWRGSEITEENLEKQLDAFTNPVREGSEKENMLYELMLKAGYLLTDKVEFIGAKARSSATDLVTPDLSRGLVNPTQTGFSPTDTTGYYSVNDGELIIALEEMNQALIEKIITAKPKKVITLDKLFIDNDQLKTNTVLQMRDAEIDFKTI